MAQSIKQARQKWEYAEIREGPSGWILTSQSQQLEIQEQGLRNVLEVVGSYGWELCVELASLQTLNTLILKRPIPPPTGAQLAIDPH